MSNKVDIKQDGSLWGVEEIPGELDCFFVQSKSCLNVKHRVCLIDCCVDGVFNGSCTCPAFLDFGMASKTERGIKPSAKTRCEHIRRAMLFYINRQLTFDVVAVMQERQRDKQLVEQDNRRPSEVAEDDKPLF